MHFSALQTQGHLRELAQLNSLADEVVWLNLEELSKSKYPAVISGIWLAENKDANSFLKKRSEAGLSTLIVPRFAAGDLAPAIGAPSSLETMAFDFETLTWEDGTIYDVSGVSYFKTSMHAGRLATAKNLGPVIFYHRSHTGAGPVLLCSAAVTGRPIGTKRSEQKKLLARIDREIEALAPAISKNEEKHPPQLFNACDSTDPHLGLETFLMKTGDQGAALLLALYACDGNRQSPLSEIAMEVLGIRLHDNLIEETLPEIPVASNEIISKVLSKFGWGAYLRRVDRLKRSSEGK